ncbi:MAG: twin-arginine translocase subunit TatC [Terriglobia bacterium]
MADVRGMTFTQHLDELRKRLVVAIAALVVAILAAYFPALTVLNFVKGDLTLQYLGPLEPMVVRLKVAIFVGVAAAFPVILYEFLAFVSPALKRQEKKYLYPGLFFAILLFGIGVVLGFQYILPLGKAWLFGQAGDTIIQGLTASQYISFVGWFVLGFGLAFETPLVIFLLIKLGVVDRRTLRKQWRYVYVIILLAAAIATPDWSPVTMMAVAIPMAILYEAGLLLTRFF